MISAKEQIKIICKGVENLVSEEELMQKLEQGRPLTIKLGLDPSAPDIHIGHAVVLRKIRQMQNLGHKVVIVIGDFTGRIGDPTGKAKGRVALSEEKVKENAATYCEQIFRILDKSKTEVRFNSKWLSQLKFEEIIKLASTTTVARMLERDDFSNRYKNGVAIGIHEFFYPLMQAYDSVELKADIELGGTDQTFNILMGRTLQKTMGQEQQIAMFMPLLEGLDGVEKMSKSLNNYIGVSEPSEVMFKKCMEIPDSLIIKYFDLATDEHPDKIQEIKEQLEKGRNPRDVKYELAEIITGLYHSQEELGKAKKFYEEAFAKKSIPDDIPEIELSKSGLQCLNDIIPKLKDMDMIPSRKEFMRLLSQGGVSVNGEKISNRDINMELQNGLVLKIGKKHFARLK
ncbi:tyrosyl-tRNA synthetase [Hathewaya proteolytica DSM 3090]|uniref:Tyrosine--tRNA ligase n=1 Tax=Hathewaya proteolytica DSM 3090 TaxID=1121331 RepID=A0A1M6QXM6_9CLOT|nr:tyrosine--tRNA ligase [Hathewaya proteolytica]SHK24954.1 tyrosyl-tRNA synthetase [Hathewaya proteolytica DSM 3090]